MKAILILGLCFCAIVVQAQTSKELIGKWKLVKETKNGKDKEIKEDTYQVFKEGGEFQGVVGKKSRKGKWSLSGDNKELTVKISIVTVPFKVEYFDAQRRVISSESTGTLEYEKVPE
ncbi:MAG TPA: lipocalin family protein [Chryseolinea sp.]|nr:lipocalin family protein [Chryseolinea sp.]